MYEPHHEKTCFWHNQPAHPGSLISTFVVRCLDSVIPLVSISKISSLYLAPSAAQAGLSLPWSQIPKTGFPVAWLVYMHFLYLYSTEKKELYYMNCC